MKKMFCLLFVIAAIVGFIAMFFGFPDEFAGHRRALCYPYMAALVTMFVAGFRGLVKR